MVQVLAWGGAAYGALGCGEQVHAAPYPISVASFYAPATVVAADAAAGLSMVVVDGEACPLTDPH